MKFHSTIRKHKTTRKYKKIKTLKTAYISMQLTITNLKSVSDD